MPRTNAYVLSAALMVAGVGAAAAEGPALPGDRPENRKVQEQLDTVKVSVAFDDTPLLEALDRLQTLGNVNIVVDRPNFEEGKTVTLKLANVPLGTALKLLAEQIGLKCAVRNGVAFLSDEEGVKEPPIRGVYDVRDLLRQRVGGEEKTPEEILQDLTDNIKETIAPGTWDEQVYAGRAFDGTILITHTPEVHRKVREHLADLRRVLAVSAPAAADAVKRAPAIPELPEDRAENRAVRQAIDTTIVSIAFADTPVFDALNKLAAMGKVNIVLDRRKFRDPGRTVTLKLEKVPLGTVLTFLTRQIGMRHAIRDGVVCVGTGDDVEGPPIRVAYEALDLAKQRVGDERKDSQEMIFELLDTIKQTIAPGTWDEGSFHTARQFQGTIVIVHSPSVQHGVRELLAELRRIRGGEAK